MQVKREILFGLVGSIIIVAVIFYYIVKFKTQQQSSNDISPKTSASAIALTQSEVAKHSTANDCWIIVNAGIYQVTSYIQIHPGGSNEIIRYCGKDATQAFETKDGQGTHSSRANSDLTSLKLGDLGQTIDPQKIVQKPVVNYQEDEQND